MKKTVYHQQITELVVYWGKSKWYYYFYWVLGKLIWMEGMKSWSWKAGRMKNGVAQQPATIATGHDHSANHPYPLLKFSQIYRSSSIYCIDLDNHVRFGQNWRKGVKRSYKQNGSNPLCIPKSQPHLEKIVLRRTSGSIKRLHVINFTQSHMKNHEFRLWWWRCHWRWRLATATARWWYRWKDSGGWIDKCSLLSSDC